MQFKCQVLNSVPSTHLSLFFAAERNPQSLCNHIGNRCTEGPENIELGGTDQASKIKPQVGRRQQSVTQRIKSIAIPATGHHSTYNIASPFQPASIIAMHKSLPTNPEGRTLFTTKKENGDLCNLKSPCNPKGNRCTRGPGDIELAYRGNWRGALALPCTDCHQDCSWIQY